MFILISREPDVTTFESLVSRPVSEDMSPVVLWVAVVDVFHGDGLSFSIAMRVFLVNARNTAVYLESFCLSLACFLFTNYFFLDMIHDILACPFQTLARLMQLSLFVLS